MQHYPHIPASNQTIIAGQEQVNEKLPFTIRIVHTEQALDKAVSIRHQAYGRHVPELARQLSVPESHDAQPGTAVLLAESKLDGVPVGTMRIQTNQYGPLGVEGTVELPEWLQGQSLAEATRLGISLGRTGHVAKLALFKAYYLYCLEAGIDWMVITARAPLDRQYESMLFQDVLPGAGYIPMQHIGNIPHRVLALPVAGARQLWEDAGHSLLKFMIHTRHPDIRIDTAQDDDMRTMRVHVPVSELSLRVS
nr:hypothetical protein [Pseudomonas sp.]